VIRFDYSFDDYQLLLQGLAQKLNTPIVNDRIVFPKEYGEGYYKIVHLPNGIQAGLIDITLNSDWFIYRHQQSEKEYYILRFDEITVPGTLIISIADEKVTEKNVTTSMAYLISSVFDWSYHGTAGSQLRGVTVIFHKEWLAQYLDLESTEDVLSKYISMKADKLHMEPLDAQYRQWMQTIFESEEDNPLRTTIIQNRIMLMIERFFDHLITKMRESPKTTALAPEDINRVIAVEAILTKDLFEPPPTIQQLARQVSVSESKLKKDFKKMYGLPIYEYYQKARMKIARDKLMTGKHSVKEVAMELGYANISNFTAAFKKQFGVLPSTLLN
jgi:AraC-like DNA-binding protein